MDGHWPSGRRDIGRGRLDSVCQARFRPSDAKVSQADEKAWNDILWSKVVVHLARKSCSELVAFGEGKVVICGSSKSGASGMMTQGVVVMTQGGG